MIRLTTLVLLMTAISSAYTEAAEPSKPTYDLNVLPIFKQACASCHNANWPSKNWLNYETAYENRLAIKKRVANLTMPPVSGKLSKEDREVVLRWISQGAPR